MADELGHTPGTTIKEDPMRRTRVIGAVVSGSVLGLSVLLSLGNDDANSTPPSEAAVVPPTTSDRTPVEVEADVALPEATTNSTTANPTPTCEPGWHLAEDLTCVPPTYYDPPATNPAGPTEYVVPVDCPMEDSCTVTLDYRKVRDGHGEWVVIVTR